MKKLTKQVLVGTTLIASNLIYSQSLLKGEVVNEEGEKISNFSIIEFNTQNRIKSKKNNNTFLFLLDKPNGTIIIEHDEYEKQIIEYKDVLNIRFLRKIVLKRKDQSKIIVVK